TAGRRLGGPHRSDRSRAQCVDKPDRGRASRAVPASPRPLHGRRGGGSGPPGRPRGSAPPSPGPGGGLHGARRPGREPVLRRPEGLAGPVFDGPTRHGSVWVLTPFPPALVTSARVTGGRMGCSHRAASLLSAAASTGRSPA